MQRSVRERIQFYDDRVGECVERLHQEFHGESLDDQTWQQVKLLYIGLLTNHKQPELAETFTAKFRYMEGGATSPVRLLYQFKDKPGHDTQAFRQHAAWITLRCLECFAKKQPMQRMTRPELGYAYFLRRSREGRK